MFIFTLKITVYPLLREGFYRLPKEDACLELY